MAKKMLQDPQLMQTFKNYVDILGGEKCTNWSQVASYLKSTCNFVTKQPQHLKRIWNRLFGENQELTPKQLAQLLRIAVKSRFKSIDDQNKKITFINQKRLARVYLKKILLIFISMLCRKKRKLIKVFRKVNFRSIILLLQGIDLQIEEKEIYEIKQYGKLLEQLYLCFCDNIEQGRPSLFKQLRGIINRQQFHHIIAYVEYIDGLRKIFTKEFLEDQLFNHPFLKKSIQENKQSQIYMNLIEYVDWEAKYKLYNQIQPNEQSLQIMELNKFEVQTEMKVKINKRQDKRKIFKRVAYCRDPKTIVFKQDEIDLIEEQDPLDMLIVRKDRLQTLYEEAFEYEIKLQK